MRKATTVLVVLAMLLSLLVVPAAAADGKEIIAGADFHATFEDGIKDDTGNYALAAEGDVPTVDGRFGKGVSTDSADHYFYSDNLEVGADSWTLTAWINVEDHASDMALIANKDWNSGGNPGFVISQKDDCWRFNGNPGSRFDYNPSFNEAQLKPDRGQWYHLAVVVDRAAGEIRWYVNGYITTDPFPIADNGDGDLDSGMPLTFGQDGTGTYGDGFVKATFDEIAFFKRALTQDEVVAVYTYAPDGYEPATLAERVEKKEGPSDNPAPATGESAGIVTDGLVIYYDGANNQGIGQDKNATVWRDVSGNGYDFEVSLDGNNHWTDKSYYIDSTSNYFPKKVTEIANGENYTIELALGEIEQPGTNWISFIISDNDEFSLFRRVENNVLEYKYNDANGDRPIADDGEELFNNSTVAVTFNYEDMDCLVYVDGEEVASGVPLYTNVANAMHLGSDASTRNWLGDVYAIRFYDRDLTPDEIAKNAAADTERYRSGKPIEIPAIEAAPAEPEAPAVEKTISMAKTEFKVGEPVLVTATGEGTDWVGLYKEGDVPGGGPSSTAWYYVTEHNGEEYAITDALPAGNYTMGLYLNDGYELYGEVIPFTVVEEAPAPTYPASGESGNALVGTVIGNAEGWGGNAAAGAAAAFDGDPATFFDPLGQGDGYCGMDMGKKVVLEKVAILSRHVDADWNGRFKGAEIRGNNEDNVETAVTLWKSDVEGTAPDYYVITDFENNDGYQYYFYYNTENHGDVAEVEFYGTDYVEPAAEEPAEEPAAEEPDTQVSEELETKAEAPQTFDFGVIAAVSAILALGGFALSRKKH